MQGNGVSSFADAGIAPALNPVNFTSFSYGAWFKGNPADNRSFECLMAANDSTWRAQINSAGKVQAHGNVDVTSPSVYNDGNWHQFIITAQSVLTNATIGVFTNTLYVDGVPVLSSVSGATNNPAAAPGPEVLLGDEAGNTNSSLSGAGRSWAGSLCEAVFFNGTVLSSNQVKALYDSAGVPPFILTQPVVSSVTNSGSAFTNIATANGSSTLMYQWYQSTDGGLTYAAAAGQTNASLIYNPVVKANAGNYYLLVTNNYGSATSVVASLTVLTFPIINAQYPVPYTNPFNLYSGASPTFSIPSVAGATPIHYQWYTNGVGMGGQTSSSLTVTNVQVVSFTNNYCIVTNTFGAVTSYVWSANVILAPAGPYPRQVMALGPMTYWRLNEPDDTLSDGNPGALAQDYFGGYNGIYTNVNLSQPGYETNKIPDTDPETSAQFGLFSYPNSYAGTIQGVDFSTGFGTNAEFTVEAWVNGGGQSAGDAGIASKGYFNNEQFTLDCGAANKAYRFTIRSASGQAYAAGSTQIANDSTWHHLVGVCDEAHSNISLYIDGVLTGSSPITNGAGALANDAAVPVIIGSRQTSATSGADQQFYGYINDVAIFKYALSAAQVQAEYNAAGAAPYFTQQLPTNTIVIAGQTLTIADAVGGTAPITNQWWDYTEGTNFPGQTNMTLVISNVSLALDGHQVYLQAANNYGTTNSSLVTLSILPGFPVITTNAAPANAVVYAGNIVNYFISVVGMSPLHYQWYQNGTPIFGATSSSFTTPAPLGMNTFICTVSNSYNGGSITSSVPVTLLGLNIYTPPYPDIVLADGPIAYWRLDEGPNNGAGNNGVTAHDIAGGHDGSYTNAILGLPGYNAFDPATVANFGTFATSYSYAQEQDLSGLGTTNIDFSETSDGNSEFSVEAWAKGAVGQTLNNRIVNKGHFFDEQFALDLGTTSPSTAYRFTLRDASGTAHDARSTIVPDGNWHHLVGVCDEVNGLVEIYIDGVLNATNNFNPNFLPGSGLFVDPQLVTIGNADTTSTGTGVYTAQFIGSIADVALYNYPLSSSQVAAHYKSGLAQIPAPLTFTSVSPGHMQLNWGFGTLQSATNVVGPYINVPSATAPYTVPTTNAQTYYRLLNP